MQGLRDLELKQAYHKPEDDVATDFYLPCLARAVTYDRAVGYFSSAIYVLAWPSLKTFVNAGGKIRLICSPVLAQPDVEALAEGYSARANDAQGQALKAEFNRLLHGTGTKKPARVLATLVAMSVVDLRIAWVGAEAGGKGKRLFHDKVGIFRDAFSNCVAFKGSMNETWPGLSPDGNLESVDVFASWGGDREFQRVSDEQNYFARLWANQYPGVVTVPMPEVALESLVSAADPEHWADFVDEIVHEMYETSDARHECREPELEDYAHASADTSHRKTRTLRVHQAAALEAWKKLGRRGIFKHATGSGKTFTALCAAREAFALREVVVVVVPSDLLLQQWAAQIKSEFEQIAVRILLCGGGHSDWRRDGRLSAWTRHRQDASPRCIVTTLQTACTEEFLGKCSQGKHLFLIADEVHRTGAPEARKLFTLDSGPRLGLSATPERFGDPEGTELILQYFGGIVPPSFSLFDAIQAKALTPYAYHVHRVSLESDEQAAWNQLSTEIGRLVARSGKSDGDPDAESRLKLLLIRRARIAKAARQKVSAAVQVILDSYCDGDHWIVYCDDQMQLAAVRDRLREVGCPKVVEYHTSMNGDQSKTLDLFQHQGGVVVSIRCLDEGVDIPAVSHALILASSKNPREYVQRRGRVLRLSPGKHVSHIHDVLVTPLFDPDEPVTTTLLEGELARAIEFGTNAINPGCITDLERLAIEHGLDWASLAMTGMEEDDEQSNLENAR